MEKAGRPPLPESAFTVRPGTALPRSNAEVMDRAVNAACVNAVTATGTSPSASVRRRAVTTICWSSGLDSDPSAAGASSEKDGIEAAIKPTPRQTLNDPAPDEMLRIANPPLFVKPPAKRFKVITQPACFIMITQYRIRSEMQISYRPFRANLWQYGKGSCLISYQNCCS